jgi:hypothetical protein
VFPDGSPWSTWAIGANMDDAMEKAAHMALTALCLQLCCFAKGGGLVFAIFMAWFEGELVSYLVYLYLLLFSCIFFILT